MTGSSLPWQFVLFLLITTLTSMIIHNTNQYAVLSDAQRYLDRFQTNMITVDQLVFITNFIILSLICELVYEATKSWRIAFTALLGFSVSLMVYFSLLAQAAVIIIALYLWVKVPADRRWGGAQFMAAVIICALLHKFGGPLILAVYLVKVLYDKNIFYYFHRQIEIKKLAYPLSLIGFLILAYILLAPVFQSGERVSFFYYFLLPTSLGSYDVIMWFALFGLLYKMLVSCKDNEQELLMAAVCFFGAIINYAFFSHLEIDIWRMLIFFELVAWIRIAQNQDNAFVKWLPVFMLLMGMERLIVGLMV